METLSKYLESLSRTKIERKQLALEVALVAATSTFLYASYRLWNSKNKRLLGLKEIPEAASGYPYVGHLLSLGDIPAKTISKWHAELGPIFKIRMGVINWILVDDPELAHKIFVTNGAEASNRPNSHFGFKYYSKGGNGISTAQPGPGLKANRAAALSVLAPRQITDHYMGSIKQEAIDLVTRLLESTAKAGFTEPIKYLELNSINVVFQSCFGRKFDSIDDPEFLHAVDLVERTMFYAAPQQDVAVFLPVMKLFKVFGTSDAKMESFILNERDPEYKRYIAEAEECKEPNIVKSLKETGYNFTEDGRLALMADMIAAGTDTVSVTLHWGFAILCHYPQVQAKMSAEIDCFIKEHGRFPEFSERDQVPYCISVMKECMRYKPTTPFGLPHVTTTDLVVDGYLIPQGTTVIANMLSMHTQPAYFSDPHKFIPERFMDNLKTMQSAANGKFEERDHFNFGFGRRVCPGIYLAEVELFCAVVRLYAKARIEPFDGLPDLEGCRNGGLTLNPLTYKVKFVKREDALI